MQHPKSITPEIEGKSFLVEIPTQSGQIFCRVLLQESEQTFEWQIEVNGPEQQVSLHFPFLSALSAGENSHWVDFYSLKNRQGQVMARRRDFNAPLVVTNGDCSLVIQQQGPLIEGVYSPEQLLNAPGLNILVQDTPKTIYQGTIVLVEGGWREAFGQIRSHLRTQVDLSEYQREDLKWYSDQFVQHFTFLYGREILDLDNGEFNLERFLTDGERDFGGYDGFLIWGVYPRIGIDERTQWDFYDDMPGGREKLKQMSRQARERGTRFFVPYKPWDRSADYHHRQMPPDEELLANLIVDTEADGVFLDTMDMITPEFRKAIDQKKPGVVFCSEGRTQGKALDLVTGCWEQSGGGNFNQGNWKGGPETMPMTDLWRFVLPEHRLFVINRLTMGEDRMNIILQGFFNGMGWVVWQDIFGLTLPFTSSEASLLKRCRDIFRENKAAVNSAAPTPLIETLVEGLFANEFPAQSKRMWTFYNENDHPITGEVLAVQPRPGFHFVDVWNNRGLKSEQNQALSLEIGPKQAGCVIEYPELIEVSESGVRVKNPQPNTEIVILDRGGTKKYPVTDGVCIVPAQKVENAVIKLLQEGEVLDQVFTGREN